MIRSGRGPLSPAGASHQLHPKRGEATGLVPGQRLGRFYALARFLDTRTLTLTLQAAGLRVTAARSTLRQPPSDQRRPEPAVPGLQSTARFLAVQAR